MQIGFLATESYYVDHLVSIWLALPPTARGPFFCSQEASQQAIRYGLKRKDILLVSGTRRQIAKVLQTIFSGPVLTASYSNWRIVVTAKLPAPYIPHGQGGPGPGLNLWYNNKEHLDLMLCPTPYAVLPDLPCAIIGGQPKLDRWYNRQPKNSSPLLAISFRWREEHSALSHYRPYLKEVKLQAEKRGLSLLGHGHPLRYKKEFQEVWRSVGIPTHGSFEYVLEHADVYAADCSSSSFEFVGLDRPVIFLDCPKYRGETRAPRFTHSDAGIINKHPLELVEDAIRAYEDPPEVAAKRREIASVLHEGFEGNASKRAADTLMEFYENRNLR